jgi:hypothetical protein
MPTTHGRSPSQSIYGQEMPSISFFRFAAVVASVKD